MNDRMKKCGELRLSGTEFSQLMHAVVEKGVPFKFRGTGSSMTPFIRDGDVVTVTPLPNNAPRVGDIVAAIHPRTGRLVVHRVVGVIRQSCILKGDNVAQPDGLFGEENVLGRVTRVERNGKKNFLGLGPERLLVAALSRMGVLSFLSTTLSRVLLTKGETDYEHFFCIKS